MLLFRRGYRRTADALPCTLYLVMNRGNYPGSGCTKWSVVWVLLKISSAEIRGPGKSSSRWEYLVFGLGRRSSRYVTYCRFRSQIPGVERRLAGQGPSTSRRTEWPCSMYVCLATSPGAAADSVPVRESQGSLAWFGFLSLLPGRIVCFLSVPPQWIGPTCLGPRVAEIDNWWVCSSSQPMVWAKV